MIGQTWPSEMRTFRDPKTGRNVTQIATPPLPSPH